MEDAGVEEHLEFVYKVSLLDLLGHLQVLSGTARRDNVVGTESDSDAVAELCAELKSLDATGEVMELDYVVV